MKILQKYLFALFSVSLFFAAPLSVFAQTAEQQAACVQQTGSSTSIAYEACIAQAVNTEQAARDTCSERLGGPTSAGFDQCLTQETNNSATSTPSAGDINDSSSGEESFQLPDGGDLGCDPNVTSTCESEDTCTDLENDCALIDRINGGLNLMAFITLPIIILMVVVGGVQYSASNGDPSKVQASKDRIYKALLALVSFIFMWSFLQWLIPGGVV